MKRLPLINWLLTLLIIGVNSYTLILPLLPELTYRYVPKSTTYIDSDGQLKPDIPPPAENTLIIPRMKLDETVLVGNDKNLLHKGTWHRPNTSTPDQGSNTVLVGHRFAYGQNSAFYHLNKLQTGDQIVLWWDGLRYDYRVTGSKVVSPNETSVEAPTDDSRLTLYTCHPLWTADQRLVVTAERINQ